jgi:calcium/proton exchanger cax
MNYVLLAFIPVSLALRYLLDVPPTWVFVAGAAAIGLLADWVRRATEQLAHRAGATIGGLLNVSFGNIAELVLALFVLSEAKTQVEVAGCRNLGGRKQVGVVDFQIGKGCTVLSGER